jgi:hypothetical protein
VLLASVVAVLVAGVLTLTITTQWKISLHLVGITGAVTVLVLLFGPLALLLAPLVPLVGWARWQVRAHGGAGSGWDRAGGCDRSRHVLGVWDSLRLEVAGCGTSV